MIKLENVDFSYKGKNKVLKNINLEINEGECIAIIGKNGSGKSTLARLIAVIEPPTNGKIEIDEIDVTSKKQFIELRKKIGIVFQNPENQIIFGKVHDDIAFSLKNLKLDNIDERIKNSLEKTGMKEYEEQDAFSLSMGQKQRITIASVLAIGAKYIVLDEPTAMIDPKGKEEIYKIISSLKKDRHTVIYITNVIDEILLADKIIIIDNGEVVHSFNKTEIIENIDKIQECDVKIPTIVNTILELRKIGIEIKLEKWTMDELVKKIVDICGEIR